MITVRMHQNSLYPLIGLKANQKGKVSRKVSFKLSFAVFLYAYLLQKSC